MRVFIKRCLETFYILKNRLRLKNRNFTLLSNDCIGGVITHNCGQPFNSPTVNLFFEDLDGYLTFLEHIDEFKTLPIKFLRDEIIINSAHSYPVGILRSLSYGDVIVHFMHYHSFEEAEQCWRRRCLRINTNNTFAILHFHEWDDKMAELIKRFAALPFKGKLAITYPGVVSGAINLTGMSLFIHPDIKEYSSGKLLHWKNRLCRRWIDDLDYVKFLDEKLS